MSTQTTTMPYSPALSRPAHPIWLVARREILDHLLSLRFYVCLIITMFLMSFSAFVMYRDYQLRMENYNVMVERAHPRAGEAGIMAVVKPSALSIFARGLEDSMDRGYTIDSYLGINPHHRQASSDSLFSLFAPPDLLYVVRIVFSLVALLFAYDFVSRERENGTLKLMLSSPLSRSSLLAGKVVGGLAVVIAPFVIFFLAVICGVLLTGKFSFSSDDYLRMGLMLLSSILYIGVFFGLGALVSSLVHSSAFSLVVLLFLWSLWIFVLPNLANLIAAQANPLPSAESQEMARYQEFVKNRFLDIQSKGKNPEGSLNSFNQHYNRLVEQYLARVNQLSARSEALSRISPAAVLTFLFTDLARTGVKDQNRLDRELVNYRNSILPELEKADRNSVPNVSPFHFLPSSLGGILSSGGLLNLGILSLEAILLLFAASMVFLRSDPR